MSFVKGCFLASGISLIKFILNTSNFTTRNRKCLIINQATPLLLLFGFASIGVAQTPTTKPNGAALPSNMSDKPTTGVPGEVRLAGDWAVSVA
jgi:hypothetical protein